MLSEFLHYPCFLERNTDDFESDFEHNCQISPMASSHMTIQRSKTLADKLTTMEVYIFRHGLASFGKGEGDPGLNEDGVRDVNKVVKLCNSSFGFAPNVIVSSPLVRAKETAKLARKLLSAGNNNDKIVVDECLYGDRKPNQVYALLSKYRKNDKIVLVSHMPLIFELLHDLIGAKAEVELLNGSIACIECDGKASKGKGKLRWLVPPPSSTG